MSKPGGRPLQEQLDEVLRDMRAAARYTDFEQSHSNADNYLTRLFMLLADGRSVEVQRTAHLTLRAYDRVTRYCA